MNQIFSPSRFFKYAAYQYRMRSKILLLTVSGAFIALSFLIFFMFMASNFRWYSRSWPPLFFMTGAIAAILYIGNSFPYFRKKDTTVSMIMLPASVLEKFVYEYMVRVIFFTLFFPILFYLAAYLTVSIVHFIFPAKQIASFSFDFTFNELSRKSDYLLFFYVLPALYILTSTLFITGAVIARRYPLIKTLVFVGMFILSVIGYFYLIFEDMNLDDGIEYIAQRIWETQESAIKTMFIVIVCAIITTLTYTYYKIKEKEV